MNPHSIPNQARDSEPPAGLSTVTVDSSLPPTPDPSDASDMDPRHGTVAGYNRIPCRLHCCKRAMANYKKRWEWDRHNGRSRIVSTLGTRRRIEALGALGWSRATIAAHAGMAPSNMTRLIYGETMTRSLAERLAGTYDALSMRLPSGNAQAIANVRNRAFEAGWPPPLAWDDIDDPDEDPKGWRYEPITREDRLRELVEHGSGITEACRVMQITRDSLQTWCRRKGLNDLYLTLTSRERRNMNQYADEVA